MSFFCANLFFKHLVTATKHRYTRGFGHIRKRAHCAREMMIFVRFAHRARDLRDFNIKMWFSVRASFRGGTIYIYIPASVWCSDSEHSVIYDEFLSLSHTRMLSKLGELLGHPEIEAQCSFDSSG